MYAIIRSGGKQFKVKPGETVRLDIMQAEVGDAVTLDDVLAMHDGESLSLGKPVVESASVEAKVTAHGRGKKIIVFKKKRRGGHRVKQGHRQDYTEVQIESFVLDGKTLKAPAPAKEEKKATKATKAKKTAPAKSKTDETESAE